MIDGVTPYPAYKPSGIEWLGDVPAHWEVQKLKHWLNINELVLPEDTDTEYTFDYLDIGAVETGRLATLPQRIRFGGSPSRARRVVRAGDTLVSTVRTYLKAVWWYAGRPREPLGELIASTGFAVLTPMADTHPKFVSYVCQSDSFTNRVTADSVGIAYPAIAETRLGTLEVCVPPLPEQAAIARFLDHMDRRITRCISAKEKQIALLEEYRQAVVSEAVTGRFDVRTGKPYPAYRPSNVEWLGDVPAHWEIERLKSSVKNVVEQTADHGKAGPIIALENVKSWTGGINGTASTPSFDSQLKRFRAGDVLFGKLRPYLAKVARLTTDGLCVGEFLVLRPRRGNIMEAHLEHLFRSKPIIDTINSSTFGARMPRADWQFIGRMPIPFPPLVEQTAIVCFLDGKIEKVREGVARAQGEIDLLREWRTRLIADVVTGKLDVRAAAAGLPETAALGPADGTDAPAGADDALAPDSPDRAA